MKNHPLPAILTSFTVIITLLSGCNLPTGNVSPTIDQNAAIQTAAALTVAAMATELAPQTTQLPTQPPLSTNTAEPPAPQTEQPTAEPPQATATPQPTVTPLPPTAVPVPCDKAEFVADVTVADGSTFAPGTAFVKTWRLKNVGSCTWTTSYKVVFESGAAMNGPAAISLPGSVAPGQTIDISINLKAPSTAGTYQGFWKLQNAAGARFGLGSNADKPFWVKIVVGVTEVLFAVTSATVNVDDDSVISSSCPHKFTFTAKIVVSAAGKVKYHWERSDGAKSDVKTLSFDSAGSKTVENDWTFGTAGNTYNEWIRIYIDEPNHQAFPKAHFSLTCN